MSKCDINLLDINGPFNLLPCGILGPKIKKGTLTEFS